MNICNRCDQPQAEELVRGLCKPCLLIREMQGVSAESLVSGRLTRIMEES